MVALFESACIALPKTHLVTPKQKSNPRAFLPWLCLIFLSLTLALAQLLPPRQPFCPLLSQRPKAVKGDLVVRSQFSRKARYSFSSTQTKTNYVKNVSEAMPNLNQINPLPSRPLLLINAQNAKCQASTERHRSFPSIDEIQQSKSKTRGPPAQVLAQFSSPSSPSRYRSPPRS